MAKRGGSSDWKHDDLLADLAAFLRGPDRLVWTDMQLGPSGSPRPDAFTLQKSYSKPLPSAYEIKISRSDLRSDTTSGKWQSYLRYAGSVTFAVPDGLCTVADIPDGCGLMVRKAETWRYARKATRQPVEIPRDAWMKLLIDGIGRVSSSPLPRVREVSLWTEHAGIRKRFGEAVALAARDIAAAQKLGADLKAMEQAGYRRVDKEIADHRKHRMEELAREMAQFETIKAEICEWLELAPDSRPFTIQRRIAALRAACDADARVEAAETKLGRARNSIQHALSSLISGDLA